MAQLLKWLKQAVLVQDLNPIENLWQVSLTVPMHLDWAVLQKEEKRSVPMCKAVKDWST